MSNYEKLEWDSNFFGFDVALINTVESETSFEKTLNEIRIKNYKLIYIKTEPDNKRNNLLIKKNKGILVDQKVTFTTGINTINKELISKNVTEYQYNKLNKQLLNLAYQSGEYSRFRLDKNLPEETFHRMYKIWIERSVKKEMAENIFVYKVGDYIAGMITLSVSANIGIIGLIGVDSNFRSRKIGQKLIEKTREYFLLKDIKKINVVTQLANKIACDFYKKCDFKTSGIENIYHIWF